MYVSVNGTLYRIRVHTAALLFEMSTAGTQAQCYKHNASLSSTRACPLQTEVKHEEQQLHGSTATYHSQHASEDHPKSGQELPFAWALVIPGPVEQHTKEHIKVTATQQTSLTVKKSKQIIFLCIVYVTIYHDTNQIYK